MQSCLKKSVIFSPYVRRHKTKEKKNLIDPTVESFTCKMLSDKILDEEEELQFAPTESCYTLKLCIGLVVIPDRLYEETLEGGIVKVN